MCVHNFIYNFRVLYVNSPKVYWPSGKCVSLFLAYSFIFGGQRARTRCDSALREKSGWGSQTDEINQFVCQWGNLRSSSADYHCRKLVVKMFFFFQIENWVLRRTGRDCREAFKVVWVSCSSFFYFKLFRVFRILLCFFVLITNPTSVQISFSEKGGVSLSRYAT